MSLKDRLAHAWNAFKTNPEYQQKVYSNTNTDGRPVGYGYGIRPDAPQLKLGTNKSILASIYNRIAIDVATISIQHVRIDENDRYTDMIDSDLNNCLTIEPNIDQTPFQFYMDLILTMFDEGEVAVVPTDTSLDLYTTGAYDIQAMRVGKRITDWYPKHVKVDVYNDVTGKIENILLPKDKIAIIANPLYAIMNDHGSTLQRLKQKLALLDVADNKASADKWNVAVQVPYTIRSETGRKRAEARQKQISKELSNNDYGIAYLDATEKLVQLNRPIDNGLANQIDYLTKQLYAQLGLNEEVFSGTANETSMLNYYQRTIRPILIAITSEFKRKFLTKTARTQGQSIMYFREPFSLVPLEQLANSAATLTNAEILKANEVRAALGYPPSNEPQAEQLSNANINTLDMQSNNRQDNENVQNGVSDNNTEDASQMLDELESMLDEDSDEDETEDEKRLRQLAGD